MNRIKKIWNKWCDMVDERNASLTYVNYEESWSYYTPLYAVLVPFGLIAIICGFALIGGFFTIPFKKLFFVGVIFSVFFSIGLYINWKIYYPNELKK